MRNTRTVKLTPYIREDRLTCDIFIDKGHDI